MAVSGEVAADTIGEDEAVEIFSREFEFEITVSLWVGLVIVELTEYSGSTEYSVAEYSVFEYSVFGLPLVETNVDVRDGRAESQEMLGILELWAENPLFEKKSLLFRAQSFNSLMADFRQDINRVSSFSGCLNGTFP